MVTFFIDKIIYRLNADFIAMKGTFRKLLMLPYSRLQEKFAEGWILTAVKFRGNIYLCTFDAKVKKFWKKSHKYDDKRIFWGLKLKQYVFSGKYELIIKNHFVELIY